MTHKVQQYKKRSENFKTKFKESSSLLEQREAVLRKCWEQMEVEERDLDKL